MDCPICLAPVNVDTDCVLNCAGQHVLHQNCLQQLIAALPGPLATNDQGPRGSLISYLELPSCPLCREQIHILAHIPDPRGLDGYPNNNPVASAKPRYYYDGTQGLTPGEVQTWIIDVAAAALAATNLQPDVSTDDETDIETDDEYADQQVHDDSMDEDDQEDAHAPRSLGYEICGVCGQQGEFIVYYAGTEYREEKPDDDFPPCPVCHQEVLETDSEVHACMACWAAWHENCYS